MNEAFFEALVLRLEKAADPEGVSSTIRSRVAGVLFELAEALEDVNVAPKAVMLMMHTVNALAELDEGIVAPIFQPPKVSGKTRDPHEVWRGRMFFAICVEILCMADVALVPAAKRVARIAGGKIRPLKGDKSRNSNEAQSDAKVVKSWVSNLRGGVAVPSAVAKEYSETRSRVRQIRRKLSVAEAEAFIKAWITEGRILLPP